MHSKNLIDLQDTSGYIDITNIMAEDMHEYGDPYTTCSFKTEDGVRIFWKAEPGSYTHFGEVMASHIARQFGLRSSKYFFGKYRGVKGVITRDYKKENENEVLGRDFLIDYYKATHTDKKYKADHDTYNNIEFIYEALKYNVSVNKLTKVEATKILENLLTTIMFDIAISNTDRHHKNWGLLISDNGTRSIPVFDNGRCFNFYLTQKELLSWFAEYQKNPTKENLLKVDDYFKKQDAILTSALNILPEEEKYGGLGKPYLKTLEEFKQMFPAFFNKQLKNLYSLNFTKVFKSVEEETGVSIPGLAKTVAMTSYEMRYNAIKKHFGLSKDEELPKDENLQF